MLALGLLAAAAPAPHWAFPGLGSAAQDKADQTLVHVPGSRMQLTRAATEDATRPPDWFPDRHPPAPPIVAGTGKGPACGYCHLPDGSGRIENADLRGLPVTYIEEQVRAFADGSRASAEAGYVPTQLMAKVARGLSAADLRAAAEYFSALEPVARSRVIEAARVPRSEEYAFVRRFVPGPREPIGLRIVEGPDSIAAHEARDPNETFAAWVPPGSLARGRRIAEHGAPGVPACVSCHTADLVGIAGASPTMLARQLFGFRNHARNDPGAAPMQAVAGGLSDAQIIAVAAYAGAHRPWIRAQMQASLPGER